VKRPSSSDLKKVSFPGRAFTDPKEPVDRKADAQNGENRTHADRNEITAATARGAHACSDLQRDVVEHADDAFVIALRRPSLRRIDVRAADAKLLFPYQMHGVGGPTR